MSIHSTCYELIKEFVPLNEWLSYSKSLPHNHRQIPEHWPLNAAMRHKLLFHIQWEYFNPDTVEELCEKEHLTRLYLHTFFGEHFLERWSSLMERQDGEKKEKWLHAFCKMEFLLQGSEHPEEDRISWLMHFDAEQRYGRSKRVRVIKTKSMGLVSKILDVDKTMDWSTIKSKYRNALKIHHPDKSPSDKDSTRLHEIVKEYERLVKEKEENLNHWFSS